MTPVLIACLAVLAAAFAITLIRAAQGPSPADRATGADVGYLVAIGAIAIVSVVIEAELFVDIVLVGAVVGFLATIAFAWFVDRGSS